MQEIIVFCSAAQVIQEHWRVHRKHRHMRRETYTTVSSAVTLPHEVTHTAVGLGTEDTSSLVDIETTALGCASVGTSNSASIVTNSTLSPACAETYSCMYALWSSFTSLVETAATRRSLKSTLTSAVITFSAANLAMFKTDRREHGSSITATFRPRDCAPNLADLQCTLDLDREVSMVNHRLKRVRRARLVSLSVIREAAANLFRGASISGTEPAGMKTAGQDDLLGMAMEVERIMLEAVQVW